MLQDAQAEPPAVRITAEDLLAQLLIPGDVAGSGALTAGPRCFVAAARASARSTERGCTRIPNRPAIASASPALISYGPALRARRAKGDHLVGELTRRLGVEPRRTRAASPPASTAAAVW